MPAWDYLCECGERETRVFMNWKERDAAEPIYCPDCQDRVMVRQGSAANFKIEGYNAKNGYTSGRPRRKR